jgi:uroporphyrinogen-III synthase
LNGVARIVVTRPAGQETALAERLSELGHDVVHVPLIAIEPLSDDPIDVSGYDWVVLTSANAARELRRRMTGVPAQVAAIGEATALAFGTVALVAEVSTQEGLLAALPASPGRVLFAAAAGARSLLPEALGADVVALYRTTELEHPQPVDGDLVVVASPSAARALARNTTAIPVISIGPETTRAAREHGLDVAAEAATHDLGGLVEAVERLTS